MNESRANTLERRFNKLLAASRELVMAQREVDAATLENRNELLKLEAQMNLLAAYKGLEALLMKWEVITHGSSS